jgi:muconolactone delta-isomerase
MTLIRKRIDEELDNLPSSDISAIYEQVMQLSRARKLYSSSRRQSSASIRDIWRETDAIAGNWADDIISEREDRC